MKNTFPEFARKTAEEHRKIWDNSLVIFDTNVLLSLYYYSPETRKSIIEMMKRLKSRLWMPYQVGKEFYMGRVSIIQKLETLPNNIIKDFDNLLNNAPKNSVFYKILSSMSDKLQKDIEKETKHSQQSINDDKILDTLESIYNGRVGQPMTKDECAAIDQEYKDNIANKICCPGFKDSKKENNAAGDFYIWKQILEKAKETNKNVFFVTEDTKEDWWWKNGNKLIGPKPELKQEFIKATNGLFFQMYTLQKFISINSKYEKHPVSNKVEEEIKLNKDVLTKEFWDAHTLEMIDEIPSIDIKRHFNELKQTINPCTDKIYSDNYLAKKLMAALEDIKPIENLGSYPLAEIFAQEHKTKK